MTGYEDTFLRSPLHRFLGLTFRSPEPGVAEVHLPFREELISDPDVPYLHGGILGTLLDVAGDYAVATRVGHGVPTVDMRVDFLRTAGREPLTAYARVVKLGRSVSVTDAEVRNLKGDVLAIGRIVYSTRSSSSEPSGAG
jgi:uncharacterized protein (TIGR00369 family)